MHLWQNFYLPNIYFSKHPQITIWSVTLLALIPLSYFLFSLVMLNRVARFTRYQSQLLQVMFIWIAPCIIVLMLTPELTPHSFYIFLPPFAYFISHYLLLIRRKWIAEIMLWIFILGIPLTNQLARHNRMSGVNYAALFPAAPGDEVRLKKVMVLGENLGVFKDNAMAGYFLNWNLSKEIFEEPDYYDHLAIIDNAFRQDPPQVIIDERNLFGRVLDRIPALQGKYRRDGIYYFQVSN